LRQKRWPLTAQRPSSTEYCLHPGQRTAQAGQIKRGSPLALFDTLSAYMWLRHCCTPQALHAVWQAWHTSSPHTGQRLMCSAQARPPHAQQVRPQLAQF
jgi:hypothetical protein